MSLAPQEDVADDVEVRQQSEVLVDRLDPERARVVRAVRSAAGSLRPGSRRDPDGQRLRGS